MKMTIKKMKDKLNISPVLYKPLGILALLSLMLLVVGIISPEGSWHDIAYNLFAESLGIIFAVILIDTAIRTEQDRNRERIIRGGFRELPHALVIEIQGILSAAEQASTQRQTFSLNDLSNSQLYSSFEMIDFSNMRLEMTTNDGNPVRWGDYLVQTNEILISIINKILDRYSVFFTSDEIEVLEDIASSGYTQLMTHKIAVLMKQNCSHFYFMRNSSKVMEHYLALLRRMIDIYNHYAKDDKKIVISQSGLIEWSFSIL